MEILTRHQQWTYRNAWLQALIESTAHNNRREGSALLKQERGAVSRGKSSSSRGGQTCFSIVGKRY